MNKFYKYLKVVFYYILILIGFVMASWLIWSRFIRTRTIRDVPDYYLTEYRFWILLWICIVYLLVIKTLIKPSKEIPGLKDIVDLIYMPLTTLDSAIKYNKIIKPYYYAVMVKFVAFVNFSKQDALSEHDIETIIFCLSIFPRMILIHFLVRDTFYFHHLEIFYKVVLIGLIPLIYRYFKYSCKSLYEEWVKEYEFDETRKEYTKAVMHGKVISIKEYIDIKIESTKDYLLELINYKYDSMPHVKEEVLDKFNLDKRGTKLPIYKMPIKDLEYLDALYKELMPQILQLRWYNESVEIMTRYPLIKRARIIIFGIYVICWAYILVVSYTYYPVEFNLAQSIILNFMHYFIQQGNLFL